MLAMVNIFILGLSDERINSIATFIYSITPESSYYGNKRRVKINGSCLKQDKTIHTQGTIVNIYTFYEISTNLCLY